MWEYQCQMGRVIDGDTVELIADLGFYARYRLTARLSGVDTAEIYGTRKESDEYRLGIAQTQFAREWFSRGFSEHSGNWPFIVSTEPPTGKYGRWVATVERKSDGAVLNDDIRERWPDTAQW